MEVRAKFLDLAGPVLSPARAAEMCERLWQIDACADIREVVEATAK